MRRLLIPVNGTRSAQAPIAYAIRCREAGEAVEVCLLHVEEGATQWQALMGLAGRSEMQRRTMRMFSELLRLLEGRDLDFAAYVRSGAVVFTILDAAEELACHEIVVPAPRSWLGRFLSRDIVAALEARQRGIPVVTVADERTTWRWLRLLAQ